MTTKAKASPIDIVAFEPDSNLREVSWNQTFLEETKEEYGLKHGQAVVFCNVAQDRFRLVAVFYGLAVLVLPPIDPAEKHSLYLKISQFLRRFKVHDEVAEKLEAEGRVAKIRIERRKNLAAKAAKSRRQ